MDPDDPRLRSPHGETSQQRALFFAATVQQADDSTLQELGATLQDQGTTAQERDDTPPRLADCGPVATDSPERYRIERLLGSGGGGSVYAVHDTHLGRRVALKALRPEQAARPRHAHALSHEARLTAGLEHPNILPVHDIGRSGDGRLFFTMREAPGQDLLSLIEAARCGQVPADIADTAARVEIMLRICDAVRYAHEHGVIHRDIKPANIIIGQFGEVLLVDWGTAASRSRAAVETGLFGTPMYMAPEQARRTGADERSDIYCLGTTLFHLLTLRHPLLEGNRQRFWDKKRAGQLDQLDQDVQARLPGFLLDCVLTAVHPDPSQRYQRVADLAEDLRRYQRHQVSIERCDQAARQLSAMRVQGDHAGYTAVMATIAEARSMWPDNDQARRLELRIRWHYAHFAMQRGDLDLAAGLLLPDAAEHQDLLADLQQRRRQADARQRTARLGRAALLLLVTTVLVAGIWAWRDYQLHFGAWQLVDEWRFVPGADLEGLSLVHSGTGAEQPLAPDAQGLHPAQEHILWIDAPQRAQSLRLTATVRFPEVIDGVEFHLRSDRGPTSPWWIAGRGYLGQIGGYRNLKHLLAILEESRAIDVNHSVPSALETGRLYELAMELDVDRLRLRIDGTIVLERHIPLPLNDPDLDGCGLRIWNGDRIELHALRLERLGLPRKTSPLVVPDHLHATGRTREAVDLYLRLAEDYPDTDIHEQALGRAWMAAQRLGADQALDPAVSTAILAELTAAHPTSPLLQACQEAACLRSSLDGDLGAALAQADDILRSWPDSRIAVELLDQVQHSRFDTGQTEDLLQLLGRTRDLVQLDLSDLGLTDLRPIAELPLRHLDCSHNPVSDLRPLQGMPLQELGLKQTAIQSLSALQGLPLEGLDIRDNAISDLSPLAGMPLSRLHADRNAISDLSPLAGMPLELLSLRGNRIVRLDALAGLPLEHLYLAENQIADLRPLAACSGLRRLAADANRIDDLGPLAGLQLQRLHIGDNPLASLAPLRAMPLRSLDCSDTAIRQWQGLPATLEELIAKGSLCTDGPRDLPQLRRLDLGGSAINSCDFVGSLPALQWLSLDKTSITAIGGLVGSGIEQLSLSRTHIEDASALADMPALKTLSIHDSSLDLSVLHRRAPLKRLSIVLHDQDSAALRALHAAWQAAVPTHDTVRQLAILIALQDGDHQALQAHAVPCRDGRAVISDVYLQAADLDRLCATFTARPPRLSEVQDLVAAGYRMPGHLWSDARLLGGSVCWSDGNPVPLTALSNPSRITERYSMLENAGWDKLVPVQQADVTAAAVLIWPEAD